MSSAAQVNGIPVPLGRPLSELIPMLEASGPERWAAFEAVAHTPGQDALHTLQVRAKSADPLVRRAAIEAIGKHELGREAAAVVRAALNDQSAYVVRTSCDVLGTWRDGQAHDEVAKLLRSSDAATRQTALRALAGIWRSSAFEPVLNAMQHDPDEEVRKQAAWTIRANVTKEVWERVFGIWAADPLPRHRKWAGEVAGEFGNRRVLPELHRLSDDKDGHVRDAVSRAIQAVHSRVDD